MNKRWFTLVELIVVITIIAILSTVSFISFSWYMATSRDAVRLTNLWLIHKAISVLQLNVMRLPQTDSFVTNISVSWSLAMTQGYATNTFVSTYLWIHWDMSDDYISEYPLYVLSRDKKDYQVATFLEWNSSVYSASQTYANDTYNFISRWKNLWVLLDEKNSPVNNSKDSDIDILNASDSYKFFMKTNDVSDGNIENLYKMNPRYDCERLFETGTRESWVYTVNPRWVDFKVYCHTGYPEKTFYDEVEDGDFEDSASSVWPSGKTPEAAFEWNTWLKIHKYKSFQHNNFTYVDPNTTYELSGMFKSSWIEQSRLYFGFAEYDKDFKRIASYHVWVVPWTETELTEPVKKWDKTITFKDINGSMCSKWKNRHSFDLYAVVAFDVDDSWAYNDLPNRNVNPYNGTTHPWSSYWKSMRTMTDNWDTCTVTFSWTMVHNYPAGTKIRMQQAWWNYNYIAAAGKIVPNTWTKYSWTVKGMSVQWLSNSKFRRGTQFIKPLFLANHPYSSRWANAYKNKFMILDIDNVTLTAK